MRQTVMVKLIPRVDLQVTADKLQGRKVSEKVFVPSPHLMNLDAARKLNIPVETRRERSSGISFDVIDGSRLTMVSYIQQYLRNQLNIKIFNLLSTSLKFFVSLDMELGVTSGAHEGATGTVIKANSNVLIIVSDATREDINVFADNVMDSSEVTSAKDYELHGLVMLGNMSLGIIVRLESEALQVLKGDPDRPEVLLNIYKGMLFINDRHHMEHSGFICAKEQSCVVMGGSHAMVTPSSRFETSRGRTYVPPSPRRYSRGGPPLDFGWRHTGATGQGGPDNFVGSTVKIRFGNYKGYSGRVVIRNGQLVRVELESQMKTVTVNREELSIDAGGSILLRDTPQHGIGSDTPMHRAQTPLHPYMIPMEDQGGETPVHSGTRMPMCHQAWNPYAITTPARGTSSKCQWGVLLHVHMMHQH
ncbi:hypothetical protein MKX01_003969 [Papaver californicum]|nr:hypothetical protein MKX01_003969 [Papaver californicum]